MKNLKSSKKFQGIGQELNTIFSDPKITKAIESISSQMEIASLPMRAFASEFSAQIKAIQNLDFHLLSDVKIPKFANPTRGHINFSAGLERINYKSNFESSDLPTEVTVYLREGQTLNIKMRKPTDLS